MIPHRHCILRAALIGAAATFFVTAPGCGPRQPQLGKELPPPRLPAVPPVVPTAIDPALQTRANDEIALAFNSSDAVLRAQAIEGMSRTNDPTAADRVLRGLADQNWLVRFAAAMCAGDLKLKDTYNALLAMLSDPQPSVRVAVRYALHQLGDPSHTKDLEPLSQNPDPAVRGNVALAIGLLGEPTGVRVVRPLLTDREYGVRMQAAEAMWRLRDEQGLRNLVAGTVSPYPDDQIVSVLALAAPRDQRVKQYILGKLAIEKDNKQYVELQLAAARAMGMLGSDAGYGVAIKQATSNDPRQRGLAAHALGDIARPDGQAALAKLLSDESKEVRLAAAVALRKIGIKGR